MDGRRIYNAYDNEQILGFYYEKREIEKQLLDNNILNFANQKLVSRIGIPGNVEKVPFNVLLEYLFNNHRSKVSPICSQFLQNFNKSDLEDKLNRCKGLPECYIDMALQIYSYRRNVLERMLERNQNRFFFER